MFRSLLRIFEYFSAFATPLSATFRSNVDGSISTLKFKKLNYILRGKNIHLETILALSFINIIQTLVFVLIGMVPALIVSSWMEKFIALCKNTPKGSDVDHAKRCLQLYSDVDKGFGLLFLFSFGMSQVFIIFSLFLSISQAIGSNASGWDKAVISFGYLFISFGILLNIVSLTLVLDAAHKSLKELAKDLQDNALNVSDGFERQNTANIMKDIENTGPLNGKGFFEITRGTVTGMVSIGITYVIIIVQFKISI